MKTGIELIAEERQRQIEVECWTPKHDSKHVNGELANAASYYAMTDETIDFINNQWGNDMHLHIWPFDLKWLKRTPENRIRDLQKAGALIAAEIDRIQYLTNKKTRKETVLNTIDDLVQDFLYNDREEDEDLSVHQLHQAVEEGDINIEEMVSKFRENLEEMFK